MKQRNHAFYLFLFRTINSSGKFTEHCVQMQKHTVDVVGGYVRNVMGRRMEKNSGCYALCFYKNHKWIIFVEVVLLINVYAAIVIA